MKPSKNQAAHWTRLAMVAAGLIGLAAPEARADYVLTDLGSLGGDQSEAAGIDANGRVVGNSLLAKGGPHHAFLYQQGGMTDLTSPLDRDSNARAISSNGIQIVGDKVPSGFPGALKATSFAGSFITPAPAAAFSQANGVNDLGQVVGQFFSLNTGSTQAFLSSGGVGTVLGDLPGSALTTANGINSTGQIVGESAGHAVLWSGPGNQITDLGLGVAYAINKSGQIVGETSAGQAVLWNGSVPTVLGDGVALAINNRGQAVGSANGSAVLYSGGQTIDLNTLIDPTLGWNLLEAVGINDAGQIAANGIGPGGAAHAVLLTVVPEPTSLVLLAVGAAGCLVIGRRRLIRPTGR
ncbi:MAG: PEP-CTERM sorting domain-containing protein [Isosphaeraceae bacterium]